MTAIASDVTLLDMTPGRAIDHTETFFEMDQRTNEFLATLAHELRNPLAPIKNGLQLLALMKLPLEVEAVRMMMARQVEQIVHLVENLEELHLGSLNAKGDVDKSGSTFTIPVPIVDCPGNVASHVASTHSTRVFRVLVVDDMRAMRYVTEQLLRKLGHEVRTAESGKQALELLRSFEADVVFSDMKMPLMDGHELARRIRAQTNFDDVYLVAMTGFGQLSDRDAAIDSGYDRHLTKPVEFEQLRDLFDELTLQSLITKENEFE